MHRRSVVLALAAALSTISLASAQIPQQPAPNAAMPVPVAPGTQSPIAFGQILVIGSTGPGARAVIAPDAIGAQIVAGTFHAPKEGEEVQLADGKTRKWSVAKLDEKGWLKDPAMRGGYAYVPVDAAGEIEAVLECVGHGLVYVNGEPRMGDPYKTGHVRLPIDLKAGRNELLFRGGREEDIRIVLAPVTTPFDFDLAETTLPDLVEGQAATTMLAGLIVTNASGRWEQGWTVTAGITGGPRKSAPVDPIPPYSTRAIAVEFPVPANVKGTPRLEATLKGVGPGGFEVSHAASAVLRVRRPADSRRITFRSGIDGSVQYYVLRPALVQDGASAEGLPLILTLHGASVEATNQADAYASKPWCNIVAATNRRPFGFDWEDWGRLDAMEALDHATAALRPDPRRIYLTGHSMGGHGTWQIGAHFPGVFAAIAPSAGWISFWSYAGAAAYDGGTPIENILRRAVSPSDTLALKQNYLNEGVYILHGDADDNVPVEQAREMRKQLGEFHTDFAYYERPGAGHWWGNECVDWPPLMDFLKGHTRPLARDIRHVQFVTASPAIHSSVDWASLDQQREQMKPSGVDLRLDAEKRVFAGTTTNAARFSLDLSALSTPYTAQENGKSIERTALEPGKPLTVDLDGQKLENIPWPTADLRLWLAREGDQWKLASRPAANQKGPHRSGLFKNAFTNNVLLVVGTVGTPEETAWAMAKARFDGETFWYRGNGSFQIILDAEFDPRREPDRNIVLYGNAYSNRAWKPLLGDSPVQVAEGTLTVGDKTLTGDDLACLLVRPRPGSDRACVGAVAGTGIAGMRLASRVPYFVSGTGLPDWTVVGPEALTTTKAGIRGAGFFGNDWGLSDADSAWANP